MIRAVRRLHPDRPPERLPELPSDGEHPGVLWVELEAPSAAELAEVADGLGLPSPPPTRSREIRTWIRHGDGWTFVAARHPDGRARSDGSPGTVGVVVSTTAALTVVPEGGPGLDEVAEELDAQRNLLVHGAGAVALEVLSWSLRRFRAHLDDLDERMAAVESAVFSDERTDPTREIYELAREVVALRRSAGTLAYPLDELGRDEVPAIDPQLRAWARDVGHGVERVVGQLDAYGDALLNALQAHLAKVSMRQNDDMRKISAWVAIAAVPTAIAGIYGMNFGRNMPLLDSEWGFPVVMALMVVACAALYRRFRAAGWL